MKKSAITIGSIAISLLGIYCSSINAYAQAVVSTIETDLKSQQQIVFKNGKMYIVDNYVVKRVPMANSGQVLLRVLQYKASESNQTCGKQANRVFRIESDRGRTDLNPQTFDEFVSAINYYTKFRNTWENLKSGKSKMFQYEYEKDGVLFMIGTKDDIVFGMNQENKDLFRTGNLKEIDQFSDAVNDLKKFAQNHNFDECL